MPAFPQSKCVFPIVLYKEISGKILTQYLWRPPSHQEDQGALGPGQQELTAAQGFPPLPVHRERSIGIS